MEIEVGYMIVSNEVMLFGKPDPASVPRGADREDDSGWRVFSGQETQDYADDPENFAMYNASDVVDHDPSIVPLLDRDYPVTLSAMPKPASS